LFLGIVSLKGKVELFSKFHNHWKSGGRKKIPKSFIENYHASGIKIDKDIFREFVMKNKGVYNHYK
jgi:hypothetical protein